MKKIEAIIRPDKLEDLKDALRERKVNGVTIHQVMGCGNQMGWKEYRRGSEVYVHFRQKVEVTIIVDDNKLEEVIKIILDTAQTGEVGDGKIFISNIEECIRIRTGERGKTAL